VDTAPILNQNKPKLRVSSEAKLTLSNRMRMLIKDRPPIITSKGTPPYFGLIETMAVGLKKML